VAPAGEVLAEARDLPRVAAAVAVPGETPVAVMEEPVRRGTLSVGTVPARAESGPRIEAVEAPEEALAVEDPLAAGATEVGVGHRPRALGDQVEVTAAASDRMRRHDR